MTSRFLIALGAAACVLGCVVYAFADSPPTGPWHPEITQRPRLLFGPEDLPNLRNRITREPYATLMARVRGHANAGWDPVIPTPYDAPREDANGNVAKAAAFVAWIDTNAAMADKSASILEVLDTEFGPWNLDLIDYDIHVAEAIMAYVEAYDILAGTGLVDAARLQAVEDRLGLMIANYYADYIDMLAIASGVQFNNHATKVDSAFGLAAMTLNQRDDAMKWFSYGITELQEKLVETQLNDEGTVAEGPYYGNYSALNHLPFMLAYDRLSGEDGSFLKRDFCLMGPNCNWRPVSVANLLRQPRVMAMSDWYVMIRMPDGNYAPYDDSNYDGFFNGMLVGPYQDGVLAWDWLTNTAFPLYSDRIIDLSIDMIAFFDDAVSPETPEASMGHNFYKPLSGYAVYRGGWDAADSWAMMLAENGQAREMGSGHEHADNLAVSFFARNNYLLLDPGYVAWDYHDVVMKGEHHNVPTVDGAGPPTGLLFGLGGADAFFTDGDTDGPVPFARGISSWSGADFDRTMLFPDEDYLVVIDHAHGGEAHDFGLLWHGYAGGETGFPYTQNPDGATWDRLEAAVDVHVASSLGEPVFSTIENIHGLVWMQQEKHNSLVVQAPADAADAAYISVILPYDPSASELPRAYEKIDVAGAAACRIEGDSYSDFAFAQTGRAAYAFPASDTGSARISTGLKTLFMRSADAGASGVAHTQGAGSLQIGDGPVFVVGSENRVTMEWDASAWTFTFPASGNQLLILSPAPVAIHGDANTRVYRQNNLIRVWSKEATTFEVTAAAKSFLMRKWPVVRR